MTEKNNNQLTYLLRSGDHPESSYYKNLSTRPDLISLVLPSPVSAFMVSMYVALGHLDLGEHIGGF